MADITLQPQQIQQSNPSVGGEYLENIKRLKAGDGSWEFQQGKLTVGNDTTSKLILDSITGQITFAKGNSAGSIILDVNPLDSSVNLIITSTNATYFFDTSDNYMGRIFRDSAISYGLELNGGGYIVFTSGSKIKDTGATLDIDRTLLVHNGDIALDTGKKFQVGTVPGITISSGTVNTFEMNTVGGLVTFFQKFT